MKALMLSLALVSACGTDDHKDAPAENADVAATTATPPELAIVVDDKLPICDELSLDALVYQRSTKTFFACDGDEWQRVDIAPQDGKSGESGQSGRNGTDGVAGKDGKDGVNGTNGTNGVDGTNGIDGTAVNTWIDPITGSQWLFGATTVHHAEAETACSGDYALPTPAEAISAVLHGIIVASSTVHGPTTLWDNAPPALPSPNDYSTYVDATATQKPGTFPGLAGVICIQQEI